MKLTIDIPEQIYLNAKADLLCGEDVIVKAIKNGIPHETVTEFADRCRECGREKVLDKIRAEISSLIAEYDARCERFHYKPYKPTKGFPENGVAPRNPIEIESRKWGERAEGLERALKIIDKYKVESEDKVRS